MDVRRRRALGPALAVLSVLAAGAAVVGEQRRGGEPDHSGQSVEELRGWPGAARFPVLVPAELPEGAADHPEVGFSLDTVATDADVEPRTRVWVSSYTSDVLGQDGRGASFEVVQRPGSRTEPLVRGRCQDPDVVVRRVGAATIFVCAPGMTSEGREYWSSVAFTSDLDQLAWLRD